MKYIIIFVLGFGLGAYVVRYQLPSPTAPGAVARTSTPAPDGRDVFDQKIREWHLTPDEIKEDLSRTGEVVRTQAHDVGGKISDARVIAVVKAKYILDRDLSVCTIHVSSQGGEVVLTGTVAVPDLIGRAVAMALDTNGVVNVTSKLAVGPT